MQVVEHGRRQARRLIVAMAAITLLDEAAAAADNAPNKDAAPTPTAQSVPDALRHRSGRLALEARASRAAIHLHVLRRRFWKSPRRRDPGLWLRRKVRNHPRRRH